MSVTMVMMRAAQTVMMIRSLRLPYLMRKAWQGDAIFADITVHVYASPDRLPEPLLKNREDLGVSAKVARVEQFHLREVLLLGLSLLNYALDQNSGEEEIRHHNDPFRSQFHTASNALRHEGASETDKTDFYPPVATSLPQEAPYFADVAVAIRVRASPAHEQHGRFLPTARGELVLDLSQTLVENIQQPGIHPQRGTVTKGYGGMEQASQLHRGRYVIFLMASRHQKKGQDRHLRSSPLYTMLNEIQDRRVGKL